MNRDQLAGQWKQLKGKFKQRWGKFTDDDLDQLAGQRDQLVGKIQEKYGIAKEQAEREYDEWQRLNAATNERANEA